MATERKASVFEKRLASFKQWEQPEPVLLIAQDRCLIKLLVVWQRVSLVRKKRFPKMPNSDKELCWWHWLWDSVQFCHEELSDLTGLSSDVVQQKTAILIGNRLIYPDGSISTFAEQFLKAKIVAVFNVKRHIRPAAKKLAMKQES